MQNHNNKNLLKTFLFASLLTFCSSSLAQTVQIPDSSVLTPSSIDKVQLFHDENGFYIIQNNETYSIEDCWTPPVLQNISSEKLETFLASAKIAVSQMDNGEFSLRTKLCLKGSGPVLSGIFYGATKAVAYGAMLGAAAYAVATTGGTVAPLVVAGAGEVLALTGAATTGTGLVATYVAGSAIAAEATTTIAASAVATGGATALIGGIESAAIFMGVIGMWIPWF
ncbi:hypothetical protein KAH94_05685 [bacterium]|nr:hypothetical protein [bacterium]